MGYNLIEVSKISEKVAKPKLTFGVKSVATSNNIYSASNTTFTFDSAENVTLTLDNFTFGFLKNVEYKFPTFLVPITKVAVVGGVDQIIDEVYVKVAVSDTDAVINLKLPSRGCWKLSRDRLDAACKELGLGYDVVADDLTFRVY